MDLCDLPSHAPLLYALTPPSGGRVSPALEVKTKLPQLVPLLAQCNHLSTENLDSEIETPPPALRGFFLVTVKLLHPLYLVQLFAGKDNSELEHEETHS